MKKLTIIIPAYNEEAMILPSIKRILAMPIKGVSKELIIVDDGSTDKTGLLLKRVRDKRCKIVRHNKNLGKGAAIITALGKMTGDIGVIQDADLEYDPVDINLLIAPILDGRADVVYGSRFVGSGPHRVLYFWHRLANLLITCFCDAVTNLNLTDVETGYKAFTRDVAKNLNLTEKRFSFDPEFTVKVAKRNYRIYEVGVSYAGRSYGEGKKINGYDGIVAIWTIIKYAFFKK